MTACHEEEDPVDNLSLDRGIHEIMAGEEEQGQAAHQAGEPEHGVHQAGEPVHGVHLAGEPARCEEDKTEEIIKYRIHQYRENPNMRMTGEEIELALNCDHCGPGVTEHVRKDCEDCGL